MSRRNTSQHQAFTILELLLVMVVIAVVGVLVLPSISNATASGRVEHQARAVLALARKAHALSAAEGRTYLLVIDSEKRELRLARRRDPLAEPTDDEDPELDVPATQQRWARPATFFNDVELEQVTLGEEEEVELGGEPIKIAFEPSGQADEARLVFLGPKGERRVVEVDPILGVARIVPFEEGEE